MSIQLQSQETKMTLNDCILYAVKHNNKVKNQQATNSIYHQDYLEAIGRLLPNISARTSAGFNFGRGVDEQTNAYIDVNSFSNNYNLNASLLLFDGTANYKKLQIGKISKLKGKNELENERDMLAYDIIELFYNISYNIDMVETMEEQAKESEEALHQIKRQEELGVKALPDVAEAEAKYAEDQYNLTKQRNIYTISIILLKEKMNYPIDSELIILNDEEPKMIAKINKSALDIFDQAVNINPKMKIASNELDIYTKKYKATKGNLLPTLSVDAGMSTNFFRNMDGSAYPSFNEQWRDKQGKFVSFTLSIPIFSGFSRSANVKRAKAQVIIAQNNRDDAKLNLYRDIEQAIADNNGQVDEYFQATKQREASEIAYKVNLRKYEEGLIDPLLLHTSSTRVLKAKSEEYKSKYMYYLKFKLVSYYMGEPFFYN